MIKKKQQQPCHCFIFQCSVSCGRGHKQRNVYCMAKDGSHLESDYCKHLAKPNGHRKCRGGRCPKWKAGAWSQVSNASPLWLLPYLRACGWDQRVGLCSCAWFWFFRGELGDWEGRTFMWGYLLAAESWASALSPWHSEEPRRYSFSLESIKKKN